jgi:hypothetical protein
MVGWDCLCVCVTVELVLSPIHAQKYRKVSLNKSSSLNHGKYTDDHCCTQLQFSLCESQREGEMGDVGEYK